MKITNMDLKRYDADEGMVFDWKNLEEHKYYDEEKQEWIQEHLYVKTLFIGQYDSIDNYVEVPEPEQ